MHVSSRTSRQKGLCPPAAGAHRKALNWSAPEHVNASSIHLGRGVAYPDRTAFLGDYFWIGGQPAGTGQWVTRRFCAHRRRPKIARQKRVIRRKATHPSTMRRDMYPARRFALERSVRSAPHDASLPSRKCGWMLFAQRNILRPLCAVQAVQIRNGEEPTTPL